MQSTILDLSFQGPGNIFYLPGFVVWIVSRLKGISSVIYLTLKQSFQSKPSDDSSHTQTSKKVTLIT